MLDTRVSDANLRTGRSRETDEPAHLDVVGADAVRGAAKLTSAVDRELVRPDAVDLGAQGDEEVAEILNVRLASRVAKDCRARRSDGGGDRVFGRGDTWLIEKDVGSAQPGGREMEGLVHLEGGAEPLERQKMRIDSTTTNDVSAGRRQLDRSAAREQRRRKQN